MFQSVSTVAREGRGKTYTRPIGRMRTSSNVVFIVEFFHLVPRVQEFIVHLVIVLDGFLGLVHTKLFPFNLLARRVDAEFYDKENDRRRRYDAFTND